MTNVNITNFNIINKLEYQRYSRQIILPQIGMEGQIKLKHAKILCVGSGALGSAALIYLSSVGIGTLGIVDYDLVEISNLHRQIIHQEKYINKYKTYSAKKTLQRNNSNTNIDIYKKKLNYNNVLQIIYKYDVIIDGSDNFDTKYMLNDACLFMNKTLIYGAIFQFQGQIGVFNYRGGQNYRSVYPIKPLDYEVPSCSDAGVISVIPGIIGIMQASEAIKIILGLKEILNKKILNIDIMSFNIQLISINHNINLNNKNFFQNYSNFSKKLQKNTNNLSKIYKVPTIKNTTLERIIKLIPNNILVVDVRTPSEYIITRIKASILIPLQKFYNNNTLEWLKSYRKNRAIVVYCKSNNRSVKAIQIMRSSNIYAIQLKDGISS
uniref:Probable molybdopterin-synthase adenylyltransferase n=1 Tax=Cyanidium sp. THAL103 TaxID=3027999 RepID=A0A9Y1I445_9RHOD|nr:photochlorophyllide reductase subunit ChlN [Cyanidium sp. THAL103]